MRIELYSMPNDKEGGLIKEFLIKNNINFKEIICNNICEIERAAKVRLFNNVSILKITRNHAVIVCEGFNELFLEQEIIEHIKKYKCKLY